MLVNNAARGMRFVNERFMTDPRPFWEADPEAWRLVIETNIVGVFLMSRAVVPHMLAAAGGSIINVTSTTRRWSAGASRPTDRRRPRSRR